MVRRPKVSEKEDHQSGKMDMLSMYKATDMFVIVGVECSSLDKLGSAAVLKGQSCMLSSQKGAHHEQGTTCFTYGKRWKSPLVLQL
jgi:hypothetical protein